MLEHFYSPAMQYAARRYENRRLGYAFDTWPEQPGTLYFEFLRSDGTALLLVFRLDGFSWFDGEAWCTPTDIDAAETFVCLNTSDRKGTWFIDHEGEEAAAALLASAATAIDGARAPELYRFTQSLLTRATGFMPDDLWNWVEHFNATCNLPPLDAAGMADAVCAAVGDMDRGVSNPAAANAKDD